MTDLRSVTILHLPDFFLTRNTVEFQGLVEYNRGLLFRGGVTDYSPLHEWGTGCALYIGIYSIRDHAQEGRFLKSYWV